MDNSLTKLIHIFKELRCFDGPAKEFWTQYLKNCALFCGAECALLLIANEQSSGVQWRIDQVWPENYQDSADFSALAERGEILAEKCLTKGQVSEAGLILPEQGKAVTLVGIRLDIGAEYTGHVAFFVLPGPARANVQEVMLRLSFI